MHTSRSVPSWTLFNCYLLLGILVISGYSRRFSLDTRSMQGSSAYLAGPSRKSSYSCLTARTWCLCDNPAFPKEISDLAWTVCSPASFCSPFRLYLQMIMKGRSKIALLSLSSRNILEEEVKVAYITYSIFMCIFLFICIFMHILDWFAYFVSAEWVDRVESKPVEYYMFCPSSTFWESFPWSLLETLEPFCTACEESRQSFQGLHVTQSLARAIGADGDTSTSGQWLGDSWCSACLSRKYTLWWWTGHICKNMQ